MPKCTTCSQLLHADYCWIVEETMEKTVYQCYFCKIGKDELTIVNDKTGKEEIRKKKKVSEDYKIYLKKIAEKPNVRDIILGKKKSNIISPY